MLEQILEALRGLTAAINANTAALAANPTKARTTKAANDTPDAGAKAAGTATGTGQANTVQPAQNAAAASVATGVAVDPKAAAESMVRVANEISREAAVAVLAKFGAQNFAGVKPGDYAAFKAECDAALAAKAAPASGAAGLF